VATPSRFEIVIWLPPHACWHLLNAIAVGSVMSMLTNGPWPTRGKGFITSASFYGPEFDPVAYVG
jgi:hypothetical protein